MPRCYPNIYRCIQCLPWHCQSVLILWHFDCSLDFFNFSLRGTMIHTKKPAFLRPIKSFNFLKYMPRLHLLPSRISKFSAGGPPDPPPTKRGDTTLSDSPLLMPTALGDMPVACPVSAYFQKFSIYFKTFGEPCFHRCFPPSFGSFGQEVSEKKIFRNQPTRNKNCLWQPRLLTDRLSSFREEDF